jgi:hypothetical protein
VTPEYLAKALTPCPLPTKDGWMLRAIGDAGEYILALPQKRGRLAHWEQVRRLLIKETGGKNTTMALRSPPQHISTGLSSRWVGALS